MSDKWSSSRPQFRGNQLCGTQIRPSRTARTFGPTAAVGKEANWIATVPGKGWFAIFRLYGPLDPWFDKTWRPGEIELLK